MKVEDSLPSAVTASNCGMWIAASHWERDKAIQAADKGSNE